MGKLGGEMKALAKHCGGSHKTVNDCIHIVQRFDHHLRVKRDTENAKTGQRKYEKTIFRILCVKPPISGGFLSMFKTLPKPFESSLQSIS